MVFEVAEIKLSSTNINYNNFILKISYIFKNCICTFDVIYSKINNFLYKYFSIYKMGRKIIMFKISNIFFVLRKVY